MFRVFFSESASVSGTAAPLSPLKVYLIEEKEFGRALPQIRGFSPAARVPETHRHTHRSARWTHPKEAGVCVLYKRLVFGKRLNVWRDAARGKRRFWMEAIIT